MKKKLELLMTETKDISYEAKNDTLDQAVRKIKKSCSTELIPNPVNPFSYGMVLLRLLNALRLSKIPIDQVVIDAENALNQIRTINKKRKEKEERIKRAREEQRKKQEIK